VVQHQTEPVVAADGHVIAAVGADVKAAGPDGAGGAAAALFALHELGFMPDGPGIPPEELPHLFDRYYRARQDAGKTGTGLGLSITKAILQQHDFPFGVNSTVGKGSTFWFEMKAPQ